MLPRERQNLLFSATLSDEIRKLAHGLLHDPLTVEVAARNAPAALVEHRVYLVETSQKRAVLSHLLREVVDTAGARLHAHEARRQPARRPARDRRHRRRRDPRQQVAERAHAALADFKADRVQVLVATDIAARGIDIIELPHVVNYELPHVPEDYVHRIGRTGRAGCAGSALSLVSSDEQDRLRAIERLLGRRIDVLPLDRSAIAPPWPRRLLRGRRLPHRRENRQGTAPRRPASVTRVPRTVPLPGQAVAAAAVVAVTALDVAAADPRNLHHSIGALRMNMRHLMTVALATCVCAVAQAADAPAAAPAAKPAAAAPAAPAGDQAAIAQYALGYQLGREISASEDRSQSLMEGVRDGRAGTPPKYSEQDMQAALQKLGQQVNEQRAKVAAADAQKQAPINKTFLADNSVKPGVKTTASGLQYKVVSEGTGKQPKATDTVTVELSRHADRRHRVRQLVQARPAGDVPRQRRHRRLDRSAATHEGRR